MIYTKEELELMECRVEIRECRKKYDQAVTDLYQAQMKYRYIKFKWAHPERLSDLAKRTKNDRVPVDPCTPGRDQEK